MTYKCNSFIFYLYFFSKETSVEKDAKEIDKISVYVLHLRSFFIIFELLLYCF